MLCITVVKASVREYDFCLLSHGMRMKGEGSTGTLCMLKNNQDKKKDPFLSGSDQAVHTTGQPVVFTLGVLSQFHFCVKLFHDGRKSCPLTEKVCCVL